jgi:MOSC domain-containing protein YiiM
MRVVSVQVGRPQTFPSFDGGKPFRSAIDKRPVAGPVRAGPEGLEGDAQVDRRFHGGPERALLAYAAEHYPGWRAELARPDLSFGAFGENLTCEGLTEEDSCIGDELALPAAVFQISQPRIPCSKLARRLGVRDGVERALASGRTGFYLRVLRGGAVEPGPLRLVERPFPQLTVARALRAVYAPGEDPDGVDALMACPLLSSSIREVLERRGG